MVDCPYKNMFGKVGEGVHSFRIADVAVLDVIFTFMMAFFIHMSLSRKYNYYFICIVLFVLGIMFHRLFCVRTTVDKLLFGSKV